MAGLVSKYLPVEFEGKKRRITSIDYRPDGQEVLVSYSSDYIYIFDPKVSIAGREIGGFYKTQILNNIYKGKFASKMYFNLPIFNLAFCGIDKKENDESRTTRLYVGPRKERKESKEDVKERSPPPMKVSTCGYFYCTTLK